jgi:hypothetical protein
MVKWTEKETDVLKNAFVLGYELDGISSYMKDNGHDRSVPSVRAKIASLKRTGWEPVIIEPKEESKLDWMVTLFLVIGGIIIVWYASNQM